MGEVILAVLVGFLFGTIGVGALWIWEGGKTFDTAYALGLKHGREREALAEKVRKARAQLASLGGRPDAD